MKIGIGSVMILLLILAGAAFIYQRWRRLSRSGETTGTALETERMMELGEVTTHEAAGK